jgi:hypothetical protein
MSLDRYLAILGVVLAALAWAFPRFPVELVEKLRGFKRRTVHSRLEDSVRKSRKHVATLTMIKRSMAFAVAYFYRKTLSFLAILVLLMLVQSPVSVNQLTLSDIKGWGYMTLAMTACVSMWAIFLKVTLDEALNSKLYFSIKKRHKELASKYRENKYAEKN